MASCAAMMMPRSVIEMQHKKWLVFLTSQRSTSSFLVQTLRILAENLTFSANTSVSAARAARFERERDDYVSRACTTS